MDRTSVIHVICVSYYIVTGTIRRTYICIYSLDIGFTASNGRTDAACSGTGFLRFASSHRAMELTGINVFSLIPFGGRPTFHVTSETGYTNLCRYASRNADRQTASSLTEIHIRVTRSSL